MNPSSVSSCITPLLSKISDISNAINEVQDDLEENNTAKLKQLLLNLNKACEELSLKTRTLFEACGLRKEFYFEELKKSILDVFDCQISLAPQGWMKIDMPPLPLVKKQKISQKYIRYTLSLVIEDFLNRLPNERIPFFGKAVIAYQFVFKTDTPPTALYDFDSIEIKQVNNTLADYFLTDDGPKYIKQFYFSSFEDHERTRVYLVPFDKFPQFLTESDADFSTAKP